MCNVRDEGGLNSTFGTVINSPKDNIGDTPVPEMFNQDDIIVIKTEKINTKQD